MDIFTNHFYLLTNCPGTTNTSTRVASFSQIIVHGWFQNVLRAVSVAGFLNSSSIYYLVSISILYPSLCPSSPSPS